MIGQLHKMSFDTEDHMNSWVVDLQGPYYQFHCPDGTIIKDRSNRAKATF
jgi:hypothetical protein